MKYLWLFLLFKISLFSLATSSSVALSGMGQTIFYPIDVSQRGTEIYNTFSSLGLSASPGTKTPQVSIQTTLPSLHLASYKGIQNGIIPYIQTITKTTYNTLLIISFLPGPNPSSLSQYVVLPVEQVVAFLYFQNASNLPKNQSAFISNYSNGTVPYYSVDPKERSIDIVSAVTQLMKTPFKNSLSQIWLQTTLNGPFNPQPTSPNQGLLKNITSISVSNSLIHVQFQPPGQAVLTLFVAPEQVQQILYILNPNAP